VNAPFVLPTDPAGEREPDRMHEESFVDDVAADEVAMMALSMLYRF
jgi:hypothetical protein